VQQVVFPVSIVHQHNEIRQILAGFRSIPVRNIETKVVVLDVGVDARMRLGNATELGLPIATRITQLM
jgi:hypothetical protein